MILKQCPRCKTLIPYGLPYCAKCTELAEQEKKESQNKRARGYAQQRDKRSIKFYQSREWVAVSRMRMQQDRYRCQVCGDIATEVHHKVPLDQDWEKRLDMDNLMSVCVACHNRLHKRF